MEDSSDLCSKSASTPRSRSSSPLRPSAWFQTSQIINDIVADAPLGKIFNKSLTGFYFVIALWLIWQLLSLSDNWTHGKYKPSQGEATLHNYFSNFEGYSECNIRAAELYSPPPQDDKGFYEYGTFCHDRKHLLEALSEGGRIGFDVPYKARDCNYRWFHPTEICNILTRFDSLVFIGDDSLLPIYGGLNILLRQDLTLGALDPTTMSPPLRSECHCKDQYIKEYCRAHFLTDSEKLIHTDGKNHGTPYICNRPHHAYLRFTPPTLDTTTLAKFDQLVPRAPKSAYQPIPIITSLSPSTATSAEASTFLQSTQKLADDTERNTPMLWIGPTAAGHIEIKGRKGNQEIWDFDRKMARVAKEIDVDVLGMWNLTVQAGSWDGMRFGERVAIVQAMMVVNWLSRLDSS